MDNNNEKKSLGYIMGQVAATVLVGCAVGTVMALTIRLIGWILML